MNVKLQNLDKELSELLVKPKKRRYSRKDNPAVELMRKVIDRLHADVSYMVRDGLRPRELYTDSPVRVAFLEAGLDEVCSLSVIPKNKQQVELADFSLDELEQRKTVNLIDTPLGKLIVFTLKIIVNPILTDQSR